ncbi:MAG TPA: farnesyl diphosphate synthase [Nitrospiria bacterium]|nr:farnesyl diphosphate synthase [Nitrospiria bacterium]
MDIESYLAEKRKIIELRLARVFSGGDKYLAPLDEAINYSLFSGGKMVRAILVLASGDAVSGTNEAVLNAAAAVEMVHTYSLIHDDLPSMDNDDFRRGKPSNHKVFGESIAILTGDALLTRAFSVLTDRGINPNIDPDRCMDLVYELSLAAGGSGMVGGQTVDVVNQGRDLDLKTVEYIYKNKTGALIRGAVRLGAIAAGAKDDQLLSLTNYGEKIGFAFQIVDDILDIDGNEKNTYPFILGMEKAGEIGEGLVDEAIDSLRGFDEKADPLRMIARFLRERRN